MTGQPHTTSSTTAVLEEQETDTSAELHLRGRRTRRPGVRWQEGTVDNEHMGKKKSKVCCIFHPQREFGESDEECSCSSSSSSSSSSSESDSNSDSGKNADNGEGNNKKRRTKKKRQLKKLPSPNSYEVQPDYTKKAHSHKHKHDHHKLNDDDKQTDGGHSNNDASAKDS